MKKYKTSFVVTITTDALVPQKHLRAAVKGAISCSEKLFDADGNFLDRRANVEKVTITPVGEK